MIKYLPALQKLNPTKVCRYLQNHGWNELCQVFGGRAKQFATHDGGIVVLIPLDVSCSDYIPMLERAIVDIANYNKNTIVGMLSELLNPSADIVKWRIIENETELGQIPFHTMIEYLGNIKNTLASSVQDVVNPQCFHKKLVTKKVNEELAKCSFGQTEFGSYVIKVICPLGEYQYNLFEEDLEHLPLYRQVNLKLMDSLNLIKKSSDDNSDELDDAVGAGRVSVNFLDSIANMTSVNEQAHFDINIVRSLDVPVPENAVSNVVLAHSVTPKIIDVANRYRPQEPQNVSKTFYGKIIDMAAKPNPEDRETFSVILVTLGDDNDKQKVTVSLNYLNYFNVANTAFENGNVVRVNGIYSAASRKKFLSAASITIAD